MRPCKACKSRSWVWCHKKRLILKVCQFSPTSSKEHECVCCFSVTLLLRFFRCCLLWVLFNGSLIAQHRPCLIHILACRRTLHTTGVDDDIKLNAVNIRKFHRHLLMWLWSWIQRSTGLIFRLNDNLAVWWQHQHSLKLSSPPTERQHKTQLTVYVCAQRTTADAPQLLQDFCFRCRPGCFVAETFVF